MNGEPTTSGTADGSASFWRLKPWWCQPWSILLTGVAVVLGSWLLLERWWITAPLALAVLVWWLLFLVLVPASYAEQVKGGPSSAEPNDS